MLPKKTANAEERLVAGQVFAGRYQVLNVIGSGGIGAVYKAYDNLLKDHIALKQLHAFRLYDEATRERFLLETKITRNLSHDNVVRIFDVNSQGNVLYITMEFIEGHDLKYLIRKQDSFDDAFRHNIISQLLNGMDYVHRHNIVHRDLKPHNIMVSVDSTVKILDFGLARIQYQEGMTTEGMIIGTPEYMSPEQALSREIDVRSDIYSLGIILYELYVGFTPFGGKPNPLEILHEHINGPVPDPAGYFPEIDPQIRTIIRRCLQKSPVDRFQSIKEMINAFSSISHDHGSLLKSVDIKNEDYDSIIIFDSSISRKKLQESNDACHLSEILIVDDDQLLLDMLCDQVSLVNDHVATVSSSAIAAELAKSREFAIIISDYEIDEMNGIELLEHVGRVSPNTRRILLTGKPSFQIAMEAINRKVVERFFVKPYITHQFIECIEELLHEYSTLKQIEQQKVKPVVLVVYDSHRIRQLAKHHLEDSFTILLAEDSPEALTLLEKDHPVALVSGVDLASNSGTDFVQIVRKLKGEMFPVFLCDRTQVLDTLTVAISVPLVPMDEKFETLKSILIDKLFPDVLNNAKSIVL